MSRGNTPFVYRNQHNGHNASSRIIVADVHRAQINKNRGKLVAPHPAPKKNRTSGVLLGQFSEEQCRKLFPKRPSKKRALEIKEQVDELAVIQTLALGGERDARLRAAHARMEELTTNNSKEDTKAVDLMCSCGTARMSY